MVVNHGPLHKKQERKSSPSKLNATERSYEYHGQERSDTTMLQKDPTNTMDRKKERTLMS